MNAYEEDFNAERRDRESAHDKFADREQKWMQQLEELTQERDRLTGDVLTLKDQLVAGKREVEYFTDFLWHTVYTPIFLGHTCVRTYVVLVLVTAHSHKIMRLFCVCAVVAQLSETV